MHKLVRPSGSRLLGALLAGAGGTAAILALTAGPAGAATTSGVLASAKAAIDAESAVHLVVTSKSSSEEEVLTGDLGKKEGTEHISEGKASVTIRVTPTDGYISGNSSGLTTIFGLSSADAKKVGKDWVFLKSSSSEYTELKSDATVSSLTGLLPASKGTKLSTESSKGAKLYLLKWITKATSSSPKLENSLTIAASGKSLPIEETTSSSDGKESAVFSKWNERVEVASPPSSSTIAYTKLSS